MAVWVPSEVAAEHLSMTVDAVQTMARTGRIPATKVGKSWRFDLDEVDRFLRDGRKDPWTQSAQSRAKRRVA